MHSQFGAAAARGVERAAAVTCSGQTMKEGDTPMLNDDHGTFDRDRRLEELRRAYRQAFTAGDFTTLDDIQAELDGLMNETCGGAASPSERAARYRQRAIFSRQQAEAETDPQLREQFIQAAEDYDNLATSIDNEPLGRPLAK
jgi:hypothetical protein